MDRKIETERVLLELTYWPVWWKQLQGAGHCLQISRYNIIYSIYHKHTYILIKHLPTPHPQKRTSNIAIDQFPFKHHDNKYINLS